MKLTWMQRIALAGSVLKGSLDARKGSLVASLLEGMWPSISGEPPKRQGRQFLDTYNTMPWARAPVARIANDVSTFHWRLFYEKKGGKPIKNYKWTRMPFSLRKASLLDGMNTGSVEEVERHIFLDALHNGNMMLSGKPFWKVSSSQMDLVGETFWLKERNPAGKPAAFWPLPNYWIIDTPSPSHRFFKVSFRAWQGEIPDTEIVWFKDPDPVNPYGRGSGTAQAVSDELETDEYAAKHIKQFFFNRAKPDFMVYPKGEMNTMTPEQAQDLQKRWLDQQQGFWRAFKPQFLSREVGIHEFTQNFEHLQLIQLRGHSRDTALQSYGIPPEVLGIIENSNRSTIDGAFYAYQKMTLEPRAEFWCSELQQKVLPEYDDRLILDVDSPVQEDQDFRLKAYMAKPGTVLVDEWRTLQGLQPIGGKEGELRFQAINESLEDGFDVTPDEPLPDPNNPPPPDGQNLNENPGTQSDSQKPDPKKLAKQLALLSDQDLVELYQIAGSLK